MVMSETEGLLSQIAVLEGNVREEQLQVNSAEIKFQQLNEELEALKRKNQVLLASIQKNEEQLIMKTENARDLESQLGREAIMDDNLRTEVGALQEVADKKLKINEAKITNLRTKYEEYSSKARSYHMFFIQQPSYQPIVALKAELASLQMEDDFTNDTTKQNVIDELSEELASLQREVKEKKEQREERMKELKINHSLMAESQHGEDIQRLYAELSEMQRQKEKLIQEVESISSCHFCDHHSERENLNSA